MKISLRLKVVFMTVILSMALIGASVLIASLFFTERTQKDADNDCAMAAANMAKRLDESYGGFIVNYAASMRQIYEDNYEDLVYHEQHGFASREEEAEYYKSLTAPLFPASTGFGMSYAQSEFRNNYNFVMQELLLVSNNFNTEGGYIYLYDSQNDYIVFMMDCTDDDSPLYAFPASIQRPSPQWKSAVGDANTVVTYLKKLNGVQYCYGTYPLLDEDEGTVVAYVGFNYDMAKLQTAQREFITTITIIMVIVMAVITLVYLLLAEYFLIKNIRKLSRSTVAFSDNLAEGKRLTYVDSGVKSRDEVGMLSAQFGVMQHKLIEYVDTIAQKTAEEHRRGAELSIAAEIQQEELPPSAYSDEAVSVRASFTAAKEVGGDFYDYFYVDEGRVAVVIADVTGKGIPAALFMMKAKSIIKSEVKATEDLVRAMAKANDAILENNRAGLFVTAFVGVVDVRTRRMTCVSAGHEKPYLVGEDGSVERLNVHANFVLGGIAGFPYAADEVDLGDRRLFLFTDGLNEAIDGNEEEFGYQRVEDALRISAHLGQDQVLTAMQDALGAFVGDKEPFDDVTMLSFALKDAALHLRFDDPDYDVIEQTTEAVNAAFPQLERDVLAKAGVIIDEILNNLVSYEKKEGFVVIVDAAVKADGLTLVFSSNGDAFNPLQTKEKPLTSDAAEATLGGWGIAITRSLSSGVSYARVDDRNVLEVTFAL